MTEAQFWGLFQYSHISSFNYYLLASLFSISFCLGLENICGACFGIVFVLPIQEPEIHVLQKSFSLFKLKQNWFL